MIGAIIGDVVGSTREFNEYRGIPKVGKDFTLVPENSRFTDDTVLTVALMDWALHAKLRNAESVTKYFQKWARKYSNSGFGGRFVSEWLWEDNPKPYGSFGNGSGMRVSPVAYIANSKEELLVLSDLVTGVTHNHPEGLKGARLIALATYMALHGASKEEIKKMAISMYPEIAKFSYEDLVKNYHFNELSQTTCPQALYCFLISTDFEDCVRTSASIGGDMDTLLAMSCAIAEAYYKDIPEKLIYEVWNKLPKDVQHVISEFNYFLPVKEANEPLVSLSHYNLDRFVKAQSYSYETAKIELMNGRKESHWMWYIFPQIRGLGHSSMSYVYGLDGIDEARAYFSHELLRDRLIDLCIILTKLKTNDVSEIFGGLDALKLKSCMTLFYVATKGEISFKKVLDKFFNGELDCKTLEIIEQQKKDASGE